VRLARARRLEDEALIDARWPERLFPGPTLATVLRYRASAAAELHRALARLERLQARPDEALAAAHEGPENPPAHEGPDRPALHEGPEAAAVHEGPEPVALHDPPEPAAAAPPAPAAAVPPGWVPLTADERTLWRALSTTSRHALATGIPGLAGALAA
jgi:hypothetical protein